ncbi:hypothetical protein [Vibrio paucivorans]
MDLQYCWASYLKAEQLLEQGHWPEAHRLFEEVLQHMPTHIQQAMEDEETKPCQFVCLVSGLRDAAVSQSEILNKMGQQQQAFDTLNQSYGLLQFVSIEQTQLVQTTTSILHKHSEDLLNHMAAFCSAQRNAQWMLELEHVQKAHHYFTTLKHHNDFMTHAPVLN